MAFVEKVLEYIVTSLSTDFCGIPKNQWANMTSCQYRVLFFFTTLPLTVFLFFFVFVIKFDDFITNIYYREDNSLLKRIFNRIMRIRTYDELEYAEGGGETCSCPCGHDHND